MLSADVRFEGFTHEDWSRTLSLFRPRTPSGQARDEARPQGGIVCVADGNRPVKLLHTQAGRLRLDDVLPAWPLGPEELALRHSASWAVVLQAGALDELLDEFGRRLTAEDDLTSQTILFVTLIREQLEKGKLAYHPRRLAGLPVPSAQMVDRTLSTLCPRGQSIVIGLFDRGRRWTSLALRRGESGGFDWILGPDEVRSEIGLLAGDFRRDYRHLARLMERKVGRVAFGVYAEQQTFRDLQVDPSPGAWARAATVRDVILSPVPLPLGAALGLDAGRAAASAAMRALGRSETLAAFAPFLGVVRASVLLGAESLGLPVGDDGFDALELLRRLLSRER